jgi:hypothetical protein
MAHWVVLVHGTTIMESSIMSGPIGKRKRKKNRETFQWDSLARFFLWWGITSYM